MGEFAYTFMPLMRMLQYVPPRQLVARAAYRLRRVFYQSPLYSLVLQGGSRAGAPAVHVPKVLEHPSAARGEDLAAGRFEFVGHTEQLDPANLGMAEWFPPKASALWVFHLHYFEWLADLKAANQRAAAQRYVEKWLLECDRFHPISWHPYPLSLRIVSWLAHGPWLLQGAPEALQEAFWRSLHRQAVHLSSNLELDLGGNHLIKNLKALIFAGVCLPGHQVLFIQGLARLLRELRSQILPDGCHFELSPLYHQQVLVDVLDVRTLLARTGTEPPAQLEDVIERMAEAFAALRHPDGGLALFNDSAEGTPAFAAHILKTCGGVAQPPALLPHAGYVRAQRGKTTLLADVGKVGPDQLPGHAHADCLSFELSIGNQRVFVNSGTYAYQHRLRHTLRGTEAHNTVCVNKQNSAEVFAAFRLGRRPQRVEAQVRAPTGGDVVVEAHHDGYRHLRLQHRRKWVLSADGARLRGEDTAVFPARLRPRITAHFHLHPAV